VILLVDSSVLIDTLRRRQGRQGYLNSLVADGHTLAVTAINIGEVYGGMRAHEARKISDLLDPMEAYEITPAIGRSGGRLKSEWARRGKTIALDDAIIAAVAIEYGLPLLTDNRKDFPMLELTMWPLPRVQ